MAGGMGVTKNKFIEDWATRRENAEQYFKYTRLNWARLAVFGFALPMAVYHLISSEMISPNSQARRFYKKELNSEPQLMFYPANSKPQEE